MSNWDTLSISFRIETSVRDKDDLDADYAYLEVERQLDELAAEHRADMQALVGDPRWHELSDQSYDMRMHYEAELSPSEGVIVAPTTDVRVEIYKNWLYLHSTNMWQEGGGFVEDTICEMQEGKMRMGGLTIEAVRGPQEGVFACVYHTEYRKDEPRVTTGMIGCGVYGYEGDEFVGVTAETVKWMQDEFIPNLELRVTRVVDMSAATRFNQGDAFFADHMGVFLPDTPVGEVEEPMFNDALQGFIKKLDAADED